MAIACGWCGTTEVEQWIAMDLYDNETEHAQCLRCDWRMHRQIEDEPND